MDSVVEEDKVPEQEEDSGVGTDSPKEGKMESDDLRKEIEQEPVKPAESQQSVFAICLLYSDEYKVES